MNDSTVASILIVEDEAIVALDLRYRLDDPTNVIEAYHKGGATSYIVKPIDRLKVRTTLGRAGFRPLARTP